MEPKPRGRRGIRVPHVKAPRLGSLFSAEKEPPKTPSHVPHPRRVKVPTIKPRAIGHPNVRAVNVAKDPMEKPRGPKKKKG